MFRIIFNFCNNDMKILFTLLYKRKKRLRNVMGWPCHLNSFHYAKLEAMSADFCKKENHPKTLQRKPFGHEAGQQPCLL